MSWIKTAQWVKDNHQFCMVHIPTGNKVTRKKTGYFLEALDIIEGEACGATLQEMIRAEKKITKTDCVMLDAITAQMLCAIYNALKPDQQEKFDGMPITKAVNIGWKLYEKCKV